MAEDERKLTHRQLNQTPTWAVAPVCTFFIVVSVLLKKCFTKLERFYGIGTRQLFSMLWRRSNQVQVALDLLWPYQFLNLSVASELMVLGFISLLLTFGQTYILDICIPSNLAHHMLPCNDPAPLKNKDDENGENHMRLLWFEHRFLSEGEAPPENARR